MRTFCVNCGKTEDIRKDAKGNNVCAGCGRQVETSSANLSAGTLINGFLLESKIGQGGMGVVYKAKQLNLERFVALKILSDELAKDADFVERFFREARAAASLSHPNIVQVYDAGSAEGGIYYFAMELIEGETLETKIFRDGVISPKDALNISLKIAQALEYAWDKQKLSHGDIKPENIMLNSSGGVKLADLGLAKTQHEDKALKDGGIMATPLYAPPELIAGDTYRIDFKSDMYSFGATLYNMLAGTPPFNDPSTEVVLKKHLNERPKPLSEFNLELNPAITKIVDSLLMKNPEDRPSSWKEVIKSIEKIHDVEKKVFHKSHVNISPKDIEFIKKPSTGPYVIREPVSQGAKVVKTLVLLIVFLSVLLLALYMAKLNKPPQHGNSAGTSSASSAMEKDWKKLKARVDSYTSPVQGVDEIDEYRVKNDKKLSVELQTDIMNKRNELLKRKEMNSSREQMVKDFQSKVQSLKQSLGKDLSKEKDEDLNKLVVTIEGVFVGISKNRGILVVSAADSKYLTNKSLEISQVLQNRKNDSDRLLAKKAQKDEEARKEEQRLMKEEQSKKRAELLAQNRLLDQYFLILSDISTSSDYKPLVKNLSDWAAKQNLPPDYKKKVQALVDNCPAEYPTDIFIRNSRFFSQDIPLAFEDVPSDYKFCEIDEKKGFVFENPGGKVKWYMAWNKISPRNYIALIKALISIPGTSITDKDKKMIMSYCVLRGVGSTALEVISSKPMSPDDLKTWSDITSDVKNIAKEKELIQKFSSMMTLRSENKNGEAAQVFLEIMSGTGGTVFGKRYETEFNHLATELKNFSPALNSLNFLLESKKLLAQQKYLLALANASTAKSRIGNYQALPDQVRKDIDFCVASALAGIYPTLAISNLKDMPPPFSMWETENPAFQLAAYQKMKNSDSLKDNPRVLSTLEMSGYMSAGSWENALDLFGSEALDVDSIAKLESRLGPWTSSFLFADGLLLLRYKEDKPELANVLDQIFQSIHLSGNKFTNTIMSLEYALMLREYGRILGAGLNFSDDENFRIHLMRLLAHLNISREPVSREFSEELRKMKGEFEKDNSFAVDMEFVSIIDSLNNGFREFSDDQISTFNSDKIKFKCLCSRILLTAVAKKFAVADGVDPLLKFSGAVLSAAQKNIGNNLAARTLHLQCTAIKIAIAQDAPSMLVEVNSFLDNPSIGAISLYPKFKILQTALMIASGELQKNDDTLRNLKNFIDAAGMSSGDEKKIVEAIGSGTYDKLSREFMDAGKCEDAAWAAICGSLANMRERDKAKALLDELLGKDRTIGKKVPLEWHEILLMKSISKKIFKF